jgi:hypothetical protein
MRKSERVVMVCQVAQRGDVMGRISASEPSALDARVQEETFVTRRGRLALGH